MNGPRVLYHLARADFLERTRRYSFLVLLGLAAWLGYVSASGQIIMRIYPNYTGEINSAWAGTLMSLTVTFFLGWFGFYLVKGSLSRDYQTGVGQIMATTPLTRPQYTLGKWLSNFALLGVMIVILMGEGLVMNLVSGAPLELGALVAPLFFLALPCMAIVAALAVLFETIPWLRGGLGNIVYFFLFLLLALPANETTAYIPWIDFTGFRLIGDSVARAALAVYPESQGAFTFTVTQLQDPRYFSFPGISWTADVLLPRLFFILLATGFVLLAAALFDRFNPSRQLPAKKRGAPGDIPQNALATEPEIEARPAPELRMTALGQTRSGFRFGALFLAELRLFLKGQPWWWYAIGVGLVLAQLSSDLETSRLMLVLAWVWPVLILSGAGCRENLHDTRQLVFSAPRPLLNQLPAQWLSALSVLALLGSGALLRYILAGDTFSILGWLTGLLFIPSLALAAGVLTGSGKAFEVLYVLWIYLLIQKAPPFDFLGMTPQSPLAIYTLAAFALMALAVFARWWQLKVR